MELKHISEIAQKLGIEKDIDLYGKYKAKIPWDLYLRDEYKDKKGNLILVTAITPTKAGEGKTTTLVALVDGLNYIGKKAIGALREPSMGPVFGLKGGATGGGKVTVEPSEDINLHFNGDFHALTSAINLIATVIDNHIYQGNELNINPDKIVWKRALDMNDRTLREITIGQGSKVNGIERKDGFTITVASELMAIWCLSSNKEDFINRVGNILIAYNKENKPVYLKELKITKAVYKLMKDALNPNLVQTQEHNPVLIHGGPFANIAHGCNSVIATSNALALGDYVVTEGGFGADLGASKFLDIKVRHLGVIPKCIVLVASIRAILEHGNGDFEKGFYSNVYHHYNKLRTVYGNNDNVVIAINKFADDSEEHLNQLSELCKKHHIQFALCDGFALGGKGAKELAELVVNTVESDNKFNWEPLYPIKNGNISPYRDAINKIESVCKKVYGADSVIFSDKATNKLLEYSELDGFDESYICVAKTPLSLTDDPKQKGVTSGFDIHVKDINYYSGARFIVPITGNVLLMPGLPDIPAAVKMEDEEV